MSQNRSLKDEFSYYLNHAMKTAKLKTCDGSAFRQKEYTLLLFFSDNRHHDNEAIRTFWNYARIKNSDGQTVRCM